MIPSAAKTDIITALRKNSRLLQLVPNLSDRNLRKGKNGRVCIIGGSEDYTGAPYYASMSALYSGCDLTHIICSEKAAIPIKSYSPESMVHPLIIDNHEQDRQQYLQKMSANLPKMRGIVMNASSIVIGPGLGRDIHLFEFLATHLFPGIKNKPILMDADFLWFLSSQAQDSKAKDFPFDLRGFLTALDTNKNSVILTPNQIEIHRLFQALDLKNEHHEFRIEDIGKAQLEVFSYLAASYSGFPSSYHELFVTLTRDQLDQIPSSTQLQKLSEFLSEFTNLTVFLKGQVDLIFNSEGKVFCIGQPGNLKRVGGQGDILAGILATNHNFSFYQNGPKLDLNNSVEKNHGQDRQQNTVAACILTSLLMRALGQKAYSKYSYSLTAHLMLQMLPEVIHEIYHGVCDAPGGTFGLDYNPKLQYLNI